MLDLVIGNIHGEELFAAGFWEICKISQVFLTGAGGSDEEEGGEEEVWGFHGKDVYCSSFFVLRLSFVVI